MMPEIIIKLGDNAVPIRHGEFATIAIDKDRANAQRPTDPGPENVAVLPPPELAVEAFVAGTNANAPGKFPFIKSAKDLAPGFPVREFG